MGYSEEGCPGATPCLDAFLVRLGPGGELRYGTVLGGDSNDEARGVAVDGEGRAWIGGAAFSDGVPVTADAMQPARAGGKCEMPLYVHDVANCSDGLVSAFGPAGSSPPATTTTTSTTESSSAAVTRRLTVTRRGRRVSGRLTGCAGRARLAVERRAPARWRVIRRVRTQADGRYAVRLPARAGRYRLSAPCASLRSRIIRLR